MKYITATPPPTIRNKNLYNFTLIYAAVIVLCMLGQLFRFDHVVAVVTDTNMLGGTAGVVFWTVLQVVQLFALPFLLRLHVSPLMRVISAGAAFLIPIFWAVIVGWQLSSHSDLIGVLGTEVSSLNTWWVTGIAIVVGIVGASASVASIGDYKQVKNALRK